METTTKKEFDWFDRPEVRKGLMRALWGICILTVILGFIPTSPKKEHGDKAHDAEHAHHSDDKKAGADKGHHDPTKGHFGEPLWFPSYALLGFVACVAMIAAAKGLGFVLKRNDDYWGVVEGKLLPEDIDESIR